MFNELGYPAFEDGIFNTISVTQAQITGIPVPHFILSTPVICFIMLTVI
jgi:hypothetical protein